MSDPAQAVAEVRRAVRAALGPFGDGPVLVACSGGADSLALVAAVLGLRDAHAAVVDHGLQQGSADRARDTAAQLTRMGAVARVHRVEVTGPGGPEAAARRARHVALRAARPHPAAPVLLGHTLDDQAETVLLGLGRGSGARSVAGMRAWDDPWLRPLLGVRRATTRAACAAQGLPVWDDPHNVDPRFTRVRLRHEVLPLLEDVLAGGVAAALARTAAQLREDDDALEWAAAGLRSTAQDDGGLATGPLGAAPGAVRRRVLRGWLHEAGMGGLTDGHLRAADLLAGAGPDRTGVALPGGLELVRERGRLVLRPLRWSPEADRAQHRPNAGGTSAVYDGDIASTLVTEEAIREKTAELAALVGRDYAQDCAGRGRDSDLVLVGVLKGAVMFMTDLARALPLPVQLEFMAVSSYGSSTSSSGVVRILKDLDRDIAGRHVLIVEDIIDSGLTLSWLLKNLESRGPASLQVCALLRKPDAVKVDVPVKYVGFDIPNEFVVGYGLDYAERYRDLPYIGTLHPSVYA